MLLPITAIKSRINAGLSGDRGAAHRAGISPDGRTTAPIIFAFYGSPAVPKFCGRRLKSFRSMTMFPLMAPGCSRKRSPHLRCPSPIGRSCHGRRSRGRASSTSLAEIVSVGEHVALLQPALPRRLDDGAVRFSDGELDGGRAGRAKVFGDLCRDFGMAREKGSWSHSTGANALRGYRSPLSYMRPHVASRLGRASADRRGQA
jgi:hypothetical protein